MEIMFDMFFFRTVLVDFAAQKAAIVRE